MFTSVPSGSAHADAVPLPGLLFYWCQDYIIMKRRHEKTDREAKRVPPPSRLPFRNVLLTASDGCYCWCWCCCWRWLVSCLMDKHRPRRPTNHGRPVPFWSLIALSFCCLFFASECNKVASSSKTPLCAFCGSDTFACGSNMEQALQQADNQSWPNFSLSSSSSSTNSSSGVLSAGQHSLSAKVQRMLLLLNSNHQPMFNSSNCTCIPAAWRCDRSIDCENGEDEIGCADAPVVPDKKCNPELAPCDTEGIDLENVDHNSTCKDEEFQCESDIFKQCIPKAFHCDRLNFDCVDRSDEIGCTSPTIVESSTEFIMASEGETVTLSCSSTGVPLPLVSWRRKGKTIVPRGQRVLSSSIDGIGRLTLRRLTFADQGTYTCEAANSMDTVLSPTSTVLVVRGRSNGSEGEEGLGGEGNLTSSSNIETAIYPTVSESSPISCPVSFFMCRNGLCISELYRCDGDCDCIDCWDEGAELCDSANKCKDTEVLCPSGQCVPDESSCPMQISTLDCTGDNHFGEECSNRRHECTSGTFRCRDGSCVSLSVLCDGRPNCPNEEDEDTNSTCVPGVLPCREHGLPCQHLCVATNVSHFCTCKEGYRKGQDGLSCLDVDECSIGSLSREFDFYSSPSGTFVEQALPDIQVCSQLCTNFVPGFKCSCAPGYRLSETDRRRCTAVQGGEAFLMTGLTPEHFSLYSLNRFKTFTATLQSANQTSEVQGSTIQLSSIASLKPIISMDYHYATKQIFWSDPKSKKIYSALMELNQKSLGNQADGNIHHLLSANSSLQLHKVRPIIESGLHKPAGLAVDWLNHRLYFVDSATSRIEFSSLEGTLRKVLFHQFIHKPHSIAVHPEESTLFWSDWGEPPRIERAFMDGSARQVIVSSLLSLPTGLVIDYPAKKLYWADTLQNNLQSANLDGSDRFIMSIDNVRHPVSLTLFEDHLYFSSLDSPYIQSVSKLKGRNVTNTLIRSKSGNNEFDVELKVLHLLRQPETLSALPCHSNPCSHLCLPSSNSHRCSCPFGYSFETNSSVKCQRNSNLMLLYTHARDIRAIALGQNRFVGEGDILFNDFNLAHPLPIASIVFAMSLDYDPVTSTLYWSDFVNKSIGRAKWSSSEIHRQESILTDSLEMPGGVAFDWAGGNIYFVDTGRSVIEVARADGSHRSLLVWRSVDQPRDIVLDPMKALMFWSQWNNQTASIQRAGMDGKFRVLLHSLNLTRPNGLSLDHFYRRIYWADSIRAVIECSFYDGSDRRVVISKNVQHPFAVAVAGDFIYFSDLTQKNVQQAHKLSGEVQSILFEDTDNLMDIVLLQLNRTVTRQEFVLTNACHKAKCSHLCLLSPQPPGFLCACPTGISLLEDEHTCADSMTKYLIFTTRKAIRRISLQSEHHFDVNIAIHWPMKNAYVLDVHSSTNMVFWSDVAEKAILRANMMTGRVEPVVSHGILTSNGLAVDDVNNKLYWTSADRKLIEVANLDGSFRAVLLSKDLDSPRAIAVNHKSGHMVFVDWSAVPRIERADLDGTARQVIVNQELGWPNGVTITEQERVIWADSKFGRIEQVDLNGRNRRILAESLPSPYGVTVLEGVLYFTLLANKTINRLNLSEENNSRKDKTSSAAANHVEVYARSLGNLVDIRAVDQAKRLAALSLQSNMCQVNNGGCSHLCLRNSAPGYACKCPTGMTLLADEKTCNPDISWQLLMACKTSLRRISLDSLDFHDVYLPLSNLVDVVSVDYHYSSGQVFYIDASLKEIRAVMLGNLSQIGSAEAASKPVVTFGEMSAPVSLAVDWIASNLYFSDNKRHLIEVARLDGQSRMVLIDLDMNKPRCLQLLPERGFLFFIFDSNNGIQHIERSFLDGSSRLTLFTSESGQLNGLAVEQSTEKAVPRLFFTNSFHQTIESIRIDGTERQKVISKGLTNPFGIAVHGDYLFWSSTMDGNNLIERKNMRTNTDYRSVSDNILLLQEFKIMAKFRQSFGWISTRNASSSNGLNANPCANDNGFCSHLCLFRAHGYICACPSYPDPRPCSTVPGETVVLTTPSHEKEPNNELSSLNTSFLPAEVTPKWNHVQPNENGSGNESLRLKELTDLCQDNFNLTRCNSRFAFDEHIIQVAYVLALILLSAAVLVCAILTFLCKRKIMEEEIKLSKLESPSNNVTHGLDAANHHTSLPLLTTGTGGSLSRTRPYLGGGELSAAGELRQFQQQQQQHNQFNQVPPPPPPPSLHICPPPMQLMEPHRSFVDFESHLSHPPHLWFSSHTDGASLEDAPPYHLAMSRPFNWTNSLPRHDPTGAMTMNSNQQQQQQQYHHRSAMNSPYLGAGKASRGNKANAHMTYLCLESSKLETDI